MQTKHEFLRRTAAVIAAFFTLTFTGCGQTPESPGSLPVSGVVSETTAQSGQETAGVSEGGSFTIHFIDVGQADSALVTCDGHSMLIDGGNADDSNLVYSVLQRETEGHLDYRMFLNHLTCSMASPLNNTCFYGANTTNEWVLREYIKDKEHNPTIYNGLPLHTEYRVFVDFDADEVLGISPYWRADVMKGKFKNASTPQERHDYVIYQMHEDILQSRYDDSARMILEEIKKILPAVELVGQWSIDVMRNGDDYYIIDMALAENSALNDCVPREKLRPYPQQWLPMASNS